jgi:hypothetical protein
MICPKCGISNPESAQFCLRCHYILVRRCPKCWHDQRDSPICEKCGTNIPLYWELAFEQSREAADRLWWDRTKHAASIYAQILLLPFASVAQVLRSLIIRMIASSLSNR